MPVDSDLADPKGWASAARVEAIHKDDSTWKDRHMREDHHEAGEGLNKVLGGIQIELADMRAELRSVKSALERLSPKDLPMWQKLGIVITGAIAAGTLIVYVARMPSQEKFDGLLEQVHALQIEAVRIRADIEIERKTP
jgi:hypothetical protein